MSESLWKVAEDGFGRLVAVGGNGAIFHSPDGGTTWFPRDAGVSNNLYGAAWCDDPESASGWVIVGADGVILRSVDGVTWSVVPPVVSGALFGVAFAGLTLAVGAGGVLLASADNGLTWEQKSSGTTEDLFSVNSDLGIYTIAGANDTIIVGQLATLEKEAYIHEGLFSITTQENTGFVADTTLVRFETADSLGDIVYEYLADAFMSADFQTEVFASYNHEAVELVDFLTSDTGRVLVKRVLLDGISATGSAEQAWLFLSACVEELFASGQLTAQEAMFVGEMLGVGADLSAGGSTFNRAASETVSVKAVLLLALAAAVLERVNLDPTTTWDFTYALSVVERVRSTALLAGNRETAVAVAAAFALADLSAAGLGMEALDAFTLTPAFSDMVSLYALSVEQLGLLGTPAAGATLMVTQQDGVGVATDLGSTARVQEALASGLAFAVNFGIGGQLYSGWVMNTKNFAVSEYQDYPFNSFCKIGSAYLGANSEGLYVLEGADDAGTNIDATFSLGITDFGSDKLKELDSIYLGFKLNGDMLLKTISEDGVERVYTVTGDTTKLHTRRVHPLAKGLRAMYWQLEMSNVDGVDFELDTVEFMPVVLSRRVR